MEKQTDGKTDKCKNRQIQKQIEGRQSENRLKYEQ